MIYLNDHLENQPIQILSLKSIQGQCISNSTNISFDALDDMKIISLILLYTGYKNKAMYEWYSVDDVSNYHFWIVHPTLLVTHFQLIN